MNNENIQYYQTGIKTARNKDGVHVMTYANQQLLIDKLQQENQELKQDIKNLVNIINHNCLELETTKEEFESWKRWRK